MKEICYLYRSKKRKAHSIENVFGTVENILSKHYVVKHVYLPEERYFHIPSFWKNIRQICKVRADIVHVTGEIYFSALFLKGNKSIITIHDYVSLEQLSGIKRFIDWMLMYYLPIKYCTCVTCISKKVYDETLQRFPACKDKLFLVENPLHGRFVFCEKKFNNKKPQLLFIGTLGHKNLLRLAEAVEGITCQMDIVGKLSQEQINVLEEYNIEYTNCYGISNEEVLEHYKAADIVCFPSTYEGFGMPIIEGQAIGRPVLTSNISPMKEVAGGAACLVDPYSVESIRQGIKKIIEEDEYREELVRSGLVNASKYSAESISMKYADIYEKILGK